MFRSNQPVTRRAFFNREVPLARMGELVDHLVQGAPQWLAIIGPRKVGKTSLLLEAARRFRHEELAFVVFDVTDAIPVSLDIFRRLAVLTLDRFFADEVGVALSRTLHRPADYRAALLGSSRYLALPTDLRRLVLELPERPLDEGLVRDALDLPDLLAGALGRRVVIAMDEFQELASLGSRKSLDPLPLMRSRWQRHEHVAYVISGSARTPLTELVTSRHSPFFQHFSLLELGPFSEEDAVEMIVRSSPTDKPIPAALARRAVGVFGCHPFYLQLFGETLTALPAPMDERRFKEAVQATLFARTGRLALFFKNEHRRLVGRSRGLASTLAAVAERPLRVSEVAKAIGGSTGVASQYLSRLGDAVAAGPDGAYRVDDPVFAAWVRWQLPGGTPVSMKTIGDEAEAAVAEQLSLMGFDLVYQSRGSRGAFDLLATRGATQLGVQVKRKALPLRFKRAEWGRMEADAEKWGWRWIVAAVAPSSLTITFLDPEAAATRKEVRLHASAAIENLLGWLA